MDLPVMSREQFREVIRKVKPHLTEAEIEEKLNRRDWWVLGQSANEAASSPEEK